MGRRVALGYAIAAYVVALGALIYAALFIHNPVAAVAWIFGVDLWGLMPATVDFGGPDLPLTTGVAWNTLWVGLLAVVACSTVMPAFRKTWEAVPAPIRQSTKMLAVGVALLVFFRQWRPVMGFAWSFYGTLILRLAVEGAYLAGWFLIFRGISLGGHLDFFGVRQALAHYRGVPYQPAVPRTDDVQRSQENSIVFGLLIVVFAADTMSVGRLILAVEVLGALVLLAMLGGTGMWMKALQPAPGQAARPGVAAARVAPADLPVVGGAVSPFPPVVSGALPVAGSASIAPPAAAPRAPLCARSAAELFLYLRLHPCACGDSTFAPPSRLEARGDLLVAVYSGPCPRCRSPRSFEFEALNPVPPSPYGVESYGGPAPSKIIDPGQYLAESDRWSRLSPADPKDLDPAALRRARQALATAICAMEEVLKFIPPGADAVPPSAFRTPDGLAFYQAPPGPGQFSRVRIEARLGAYREILKKYGA